MITSRLVTPAVVQRLPETIPVFPLTGALLLPEGRLPLNVFEPRYLAMVEDALAAGRLLGMIQPSLDDHEGETLSDQPMPGEPNLGSVGCLGRIVTFAETDDGRYLITLHGVSRFRVAREIEGKRGYRRVVPDWEPFRGDQDGSPEIDLDRARLLEVLGPYLALQHMEFNRKILDSATDRVLLLSLAMSCPFPPREKQALLECQDQNIRGRTLIALMELAVADAESGTSHIGDQPVVSHEDAMTVRPAEVDPKLLEILVCPLTRGPLRYDRDAQELISDQAQLAYPIRDGIPIMLPSEARTLDDSAAP